MSKNWFLILFTFALFNFPIYSLGVNSLGVFDILFLLTLIFVIFSRIKYKKPPKFIIIQSSIVGLIILSTAINLFENDILLKDILYLAKILSYCFIPIIVLEVMNYKLIEIQHRSIEFSIILIGVVVLFYSVFEAHVVYGMTRSGVPFSYGSSGPLGLVGLGFCLYYFIFRKSSIKFLFLAVGIALLFAAFSKSFILAFFALLIYKLKEVVTIKFAIVLVVLMFLGGFYVYDDLIYLYDSLENLVEISTLAERFDNHWFEYWDYFFNNNLFLFGIGKQNIDIALDSAYFYLLYSIGFLGIFVLMVLFIWFSRRDDLIKVYLISLLTSGIFLETMIVSPRGMEPFMLLLSYYYMRTKCIEN